jgi:hypothetical protein
LVSLKNIITHILQAHHFEVFEKDGIIYGEKDGDNVTIGLFDKATINEIKSHARHVSDIEGRHIICVLEAGSNAEYEARNLGLILWKKADLEAEIGRALQDNIQDSQVFKGLISPIESIPDSPTVTIECIGTEGQPKVLKSQLDIEDVKELSASSIQGFKHILELVPHYLFKYACTYEGKDGREIHKKGMVSVNALTGKYSAWDKEPEMDSPSVHQVQLEPKIDGENARKIAMHAVVHFNTEFKEIIIERDHATIIEKATFKPDEKSIILECQDLVLVPVWCVEGKHGVMILDGITGKIISEDYYEKK